MSPTFSYRDSHPEPFGFPIRQPIFIVGSGRSGTALLFDLLSQHFQVARTTDYWPQVNFRIWRTDAKPIG